MLDLARYRTPIALADGLIVAILLRAAVGVGWIWVVLIGVAVGVVTWVILGQPRPGGVAALSQAHQGELDRAKQQIATLRRIAYAPMLEPLRESLLGISDTARQIVADVTRRPADYPKVRRLLTHYLGHVEGIADRLDHMRKNGPVDAGAMERSAAMLGELRTVFEQYRQDKAAEAVSDIDARLSVLEIDLEVERK